MIFNINFIFGGEKIKLSEMKQAVELLANEWDLGKVSSKAKGNVCAWIYLFEIL